MEKQRKRKHGNAELKEKETALETDLNLGFKANVSLDSKLEEGEDSSRRDAHLETETEQSTYSRTLIDEKRSELVVESEVNVRLESGLKEDVNSLLNDIVSERECFGSESRLNEQPLNSERKSKKKKKHKMGNGGQFEEEGQESVTEPRDEKENSVIDGKQSDCVLESKVKVSLELGEKVSLESDLKGSQSNEQPADSERERKRKRRHKMAEAGESEKLNQKAVVERRDSEENSLIDEKQRDSYMESKLNVSLESRLKEAVQESENISLGSGLRENQLNEIPDDGEKGKKRKRKHKMANSEQFERLHVKSVLRLSDFEEKSLIDETQIGSHVESKLNITELNDQMIQPERKRKRKGKREREREMEKQEKRRLTATQDNDPSSKGNYRGSDEAENNNVCPDHHITNRKDFEREGLMSISENVESKNMKKHSMILDKQIDSPKDAGISVVKTQDLHDDGDLVVLEKNYNTAFQIGENLKTYQRKRKKSSDLLQGSLEPLRENSMIQTSINHLEKELTTDFAENRPDAVLVGDHAMPEQVMEEPFRYSANSEAAHKGRKRKKRKKRKKFKESFCKDPEAKDVEMELKIEEFTPLLNLTAQDNVEQKATIKGNASSTLYSLVERVCTSCPKKKLLVLDLNGILVDVVQNPGEFKPDITVSGKGVFKRPFCDDFLEFCFRTFNIGIWSSRINKNVNKLVGFLMRKWRCNLLFCWDRKQCTMTKFKTIEDKQKPLVLKELRKLWDQCFPNLPWEKGEYDESNTLLLDDSPYKALRNPANTAIFPYPYQHTDAEDTSLGHGGDIRKYLEGLAAADNVQKYVEQNPFGQLAITESDPHWDLYCQIIRP